MKKKKSRRQKNEDVKRRFEAIKDLMSTFAMSTVAVVAVVTLVPASPKAEIIKTVALNEEIVYQVNVTDEDNALDESTLFVVLENQLEYYEEPISLGENSGYFENLQSNTQYRLSVYGNKGFGQERLDTTLITTRATVGGTILRVTPTDTGHGSSYVVDVSIYDPDSKYTSINLYYGYSWEPDVAFTYTSIPVTSDRQEIELIDIWTDYPFHIYIEGTTTEGTELLDEIWITPPFTFYASASLAYQNATEIKYHVYGDYNVQDVKYLFHIYQNDMLIRTDTYTPDPNNLHEGYLIKDLRHDSTYFIEIVAVYKNPKTLAEESNTILEEEVTTTQKYTYTYHITTFDTYYEVTINLDDPFDIFTHSGFEIYDTTGEYEVITTSQTYVLETIDNKKSITFTIDIPTVEIYRIEIYLYHNMENQTKIIETLHSE